MPVFKYIISIRMCKPVMGVWEALTKQPGELLCHFPQCSLDGMARFRNRVPWLEAWALCMHWVTFASSAVTLELTALRLMNCLARLQLSKFTYLRD